mgnify:FL=1
MLMLGAAEPAHLDNYAELIRNFDENMGPACWPIIYLADVRCRSEEFDRIKRRLLMHIADGQYPPGYNADSPWNTVFKQSLPGATRDADRFWNDECDRK